MEPEPYLLSPEFMAAPVELIGDGERIWHARALTALKERDAAFDMRNEAMAALTKERADRQALLGHPNWSAMAESLRADAAVEAITTLRAECVALRAELKEARIRIGQRDASVLRAVRIR